MRVEEIEERLENRFRNNPLYGLQTIHQLAELLDEDVSLLRYLSRNAERYYREFDIFGRNGKPRHIEKPLKQLMRVQGKLQKLLKKEVPLICVSAPEKKRNIVSNANAHREGKGKASVDIKSFYHHCLPASVFQLFFEKARCSADVSGILTDLLCYKGHLPTGAPTSPVLSYLTNEFMFAYIYISLGSQFCRMSLWIDDLSISELHNSGQLDKELIGQIQYLLNGHGFRMARKKTRLYRADQIAVFNGIVLMPDGMLRMINRHHQLWFRTKEAIKTANGEDKRKLIAVEKGLKKLKHKIEKSNRRYLQQKREREARTNERNR